MATCFRDYVRCIRRCSQLNGFLDQAACALDCDLDLAVCVKNQLAISTGAEAVALSRQMRCGFALPVDLALAGEEFGGGHDGGGKDCT